MSTPKTKVQLFNDVYDAVVGDSWMWMVVWGDARSSKTTLAGWVLYSLYKDWNKVLQAFGYNISQILYKITHGIPERWPTRNLLHMRVPALNFDDFGSSSNKAVTQHDPAWDEVKGGWDVLGTKVGVVIATMCDPTEPTLQLIQKYNAEIHILGKGRYKYDRVEWSQDYHGWKAKPHKVFIEENTFDPWPDEVYREYDSVRQELCDEKLQRIEDATVMSQLDFALRMSKPIDIDILKLIDTHGPVDHDSLKPLGQDWKQAVVRLKARSLVVPVQMSKNYYRYDLSPLGKSVLDKALAQQQLKQTFPLEAIS
jgi:hypothetical protein